MTEQGPISTSDLQQSSGSLDRNPNLIVGGVYEREVGASLERVWENVYDWEHLPHIHSEAFRLIKRLASGDWGWRAQVEIAGGAQAKIELITNRDEHYYVARTIEGAGSPSEIWTTLNPLAPDRTGIRVEFCVQPMAEESLHKFAQGMTGLYTLLWNQDEEMMQARTLALADRDTQSQAERVESSAPLSISLGSIEELRPRLPLVIDFEGHAFRVVELGGADQLVAHSTECPHLLGPLDQCALREGLIACPWHGYEFDVRSGRSADGRHLRLRGAPKVAVNSDGVVIVESASGVAD